MAFWSHSFSVGEVLTAAQMNNIMNNFTELADGDAAAPSIQNAALATDSVRAAQIQANVVASSELKSDSTTEGSATLSNLGYWYPPAGICSVAVLSSAANIWVEIYVSGAWRRATTNWNQFGGGGFYSDGSYVRLYNNSGASATVYWRRLT